MKTFNKIFALILATLSLIFAGTEVAATTTGPGSITVTNASQGQTYTLYKLFDATQSADGISYKLPAGKALGAGSTWFDVDSKGNITAKANADVSGDDFKQWAQSFGQQIQEQKASSNTVLFANVPYGYYYVTSSLGATITVDSTHPNGQIIDKNDSKPKYPDTQDGGKKIVTAGGVTSSSTAKIGDTVNFQITFTATNQVTENKASKQITQYTIVDTPSDLAIDQGTVAVKVAGLDVTQRATINKAADGKLTVTIPWVNGDASIYDSPSDVVITYSAVVTKGAQDGQADNQVDVSYTTKEDGQTTAIVPQTADVTKTKVATYKFTLLKTNDNGAQLTGAQFKLYSAQTNGDEIAVVKEADGSYRVAEAGETGQLIDAGRVDIKGLKGDTTYWLEEFKAPDGYNILTDRQEVQFAQADIPEIRVINKAGGILPATGSFGTTLFYLIGSLLVVGTLIVLISKRRMNQES